MPAAAGAAARTTVRQRHGAAAGFVLFVTCLSAVLSPLATGMALALAGALVFNAAKSRA